ncbi:sensor domain-containing protein [Mycobacterium marinum]|uniref:sensor domain-containing protein n=1 Tax=Mycobacterium marinum TaxID=1781 RepID=UPI0023585B1A|nr:sensor domain-containing protein [Mycobacterium marinum]MDC8973238.1 sensor domain-containing protein [Mycobacterium marinum]
MKISLTGDRSSAIFNPMNSRFLWRRRSMGECLSSIRSVVTAVSNSAVIGCCVVAMSACTHTTTEAAPALTTDSLIVGIDDVRRIASFDDLTSEPGSDVSSPRHVDSDAPGPCRAVFDQNVAFGSGWAQFRSVTYNGTANTGPGQPHMVVVVAQGIGIYPDEDAARDAFDRLVPALTACSDMHVRHYDFTVVQPNPSTVALKSDRWDVMYRVQSSVLIDVAVLGLPQSEQTANAVVDAITDRVR